MKIKLWLLKFKLACSVLLSKIVYNLHKPVPGIAVDRNIKYLRGGGRFHKFDVYYQTDSKRLLKIFHRRKRDVSEIDDAEASDPIKTKKPCIFYFHGGGWATLDKSLYETLCKRFAQMGYVVFNCNYKLTPQNNLDGVINDCMKAIACGRWFAHQYGGDSDSIILAGDSAGGHISAQIAGMADHDLLNKYDIKGKIKALILLYGVYDLFTLESTDFKDIKLYTYSMYCHNKDSKAEIFQKYSPKNYITSSFPESIIVSGECDKLHKSQSEFFEKLLTKNGIKHSKKYIPPDDKWGFHGFMNIDKLHTNVEALASIREFLSGVDALK